MHTNIPMANVQQLLDLPITNLEWLCANEATAFWVKEVLKHYIHIHIYINIYMEICIYKHINT